MLDQALSTARLIRPARRRGFCPACRGWDPGTADRSGDAESEISPPALTAVAFLALAAVAWAVTIWQSSSAGEMAMGPGSLESFAASWAVMMTAMMLPSALPLVYEFARRSEGRRRWRAATGVLAATYLSIWLEELLAERGIKVDHVTIYRWVQRFAPEFAQAARARQHLVGDRWPVDETYLKVGGTYRIALRLAPRSTALLSAARSWSEPSASRL